MKPDFSKMNKVELKAYIRNHHEDDQAIRELFSRSDPNSKTYPMPETEEDLKQMEKIFRQKIENSQKP